MSRKDKFGAYLDAVVRDRRPPAFPADPEEARLMETAAELKAARPGSDLPSQTFLEALERRLSRDAAGSSTLSRRTALQLAGAAAAATVAGVVLDRVALNPERSPAAPTRSVLQPDRGSWVSVVAVAAVPPSSAVRFSAGAIEGFVVNNDGQIQAISAVCTHLGCILRLNAQARRLDCPCHGASFDLHGSPLNREYLASLPVLDSRIQSGQVQVRVDHQA